MRRRAPTRPNRSGAQRSEAQGIAAGALERLQSGRDFFLHHPTADAGTRYESLSDERAASIRCHRCNYECDGAGRSADYETAHYIGQDDGPGTMASFQRCDHIAPETRAVAAIGRDALDALKRECWTQHQPSARALAYAAEQRAEGMAERYIYTPPAVVARWQDVRVEALRETLPDRWSGHTLEIWLVYGADGRASATYGIGSGEPSLYMD